MIIRLLSLTQKKSNISVALSLTHILSPDLLMKVGKSQRNLQTTPLGIYCIIAEVRGPSTVRL